MCSASSGRHRAPSSPGMRVSNGWPMSSGMAMAANRRGISLRTGVGLLHVDRVDRLLKLLRPVEIERVDVGLELLHRGGADDGRGHERAGVAEFQRQLRRVDTTLAGQADEI